MHFPAFIFCHPLPLTHISQLASRPSSVLLHRQVGDAQDETPRERNAHSAPPNPVAKFRDTTHLHCKTFIGLVELLSVFTLHYQSQVLSARDEEHLGRHRLHHLLPFLSSRLRLLPVEPISSLQHKPGIRSTRRSPRNVKHITKHAAIRVKPMSLGHLFSPWPPIFFPVHFFIFLKTHLASFMIRPAFCCVECLSRQD